MESLNRMALELVDEAIDFADELAIETETLDNGATVLDFGVDAAGGYEAGLLLAEIQTGGLATVQTESGEITGTPMPHTTVHTDHPAISLLCSQKAGWEVSVDGFEGLGSGPARALVAEEDEFRRIGYADASEFATLCLESDTLPDESVADHVGKMTNTDPGSVFLPTFRTDSITGSVTLAARAGEMVAFRLAELGYDPLDIMTVHATAPIAPVADGYQAAVARTNDALAYGGQVHVTVDSEFDRFDELPSTAADEYGRPFGDIFEAADWDFYDVPTEVFAPAQVTVDVIGGETHSYGRTDEALLAESFGL
ncbi:methenyltetrahydromethanopterin cyclohydrolase [Halobacteriales archaeon QH_7_65_31]|nr:MAG: methenyltetrahydromethanopterin cyclohydrolase [Halobacteriales archaeon QH_7_65_31]